MDKRLLAMLVCPVCKGQLEYHRKLSELHCARDALAFPIRDGIPVLLEMDARKLEHDASKPG